MIEIYTETTPNPGSLKFVLANKMLVENKFAEFKSADEAKESPLASYLFELPFITSVFISNNFLTLAKSEKYEWYEIKEEVKQAIRSFFDRGGDIIINESYFKKEKETFEEGSIDSKIVMLLDKYVKPAIEMDGGHISFKSFQDGIVTVVLQGACSGCPSSSVTLKSGIEGLLQRMVPEVKEVVAEEA